MFKTIANAFKSKEVRIKLLITIGLLFLYRLGSWIPVPGLNAANMTVEADSFFSLLNGITGNALQNGTLLALGISPYINASIITQLLGIAIPALERWSHEGDDGKRKMSNFTRVVTLILAIAQAIGIAVSFSSTSGNESALTTGAFAIAGGMPEFVLGMIVVTMLVAGAIFTMWLGEKITDLGISNGISLLIFVGILSTAGQAIVATIANWAGGNMFAPWQLLMFAGLVVVIFGFITFIDMSERKIPVQYAKQIKGRKQYGGQSTYIPIKVNASGVLPIIFSTAIVSFPQLIMSMFLTPEPGSFYAWWMDWLGAGTPLYFVVNGLLILFFSYFYAQIQFKPEEVARNLQQYGGFVPGIRPGKPTAEYLSRVSKRLTLFGALYLAAVFIIPSVVMSALAAANVGLLANELVSAFSSTGMLIIVSVALEFEKQLESQLMMRQYKGFLK